MPKAKLPKSSELNYEELRNELDVVVNELQRDDLDVDKALECYKRGLELVKQLEKYLNTAENKVRDIKSNFDSQAA